MTFDIRHMLKVYNYVNDDKKPKVNLKFLSLFIAMLVAGGALVAFGLTLGAADTASVTAQQTKTDYVGLAPDEAISASPGLLDSRLQSWYDAHPTANVERVEPVYDGARLVGYRITYTDAAG